MKDRKEIEAKLKAFKEATGFKRDKISVYVLTNFDTSFDEDMHRVMFLRELGFTPFVMVYEKEKLPQKHQIRSFQRWVNKKQLFYSCSFENYRQ